MVPALGTAAPAPSAPVAGAERCRFGCALRRSFFNDAAAVRQWDGAPTEGQPPPLCRERASDICRRTRAVLSRLRTSLPPVRCGDSGHGAAQPDCVSIRWHGELGSDPCSNACARGTVPARWQWMGALESRIVTTNGSTPTAALFLAVGSRGLRRIQRGPPPMQPDEGGCMGRVEAIPLPVGAVFAGMYGKRRRPCRDRPCHRGRPCRSRPYRRREASQAARAGLFGAGRGAGQTTRDRCDPTRSASLRRQNCAPSTSI